MYMEHYGTMKKIRVIIPPNPWGASDSLSSSPRDACSSATTSEPIRATSSGTCLAKFSRSNWGCFEYWSSPKKGETYGNGALWNPGTVRSRLFFRDFTMPKSKDHAVWQLIVLDHLLTRLISHRRIFLQFHRRNFSNSQKAPFYLYGLSLEHQVLILHMDQGIWMDQHDQPPFKNQCIYIYIYIHIYIYIMYEYYIIHSYNTVQYNII